LRDAKFEHSVRAEFEHSVRAEREVVAEREKCMRKLVSLVGLALLAVASPANAATATFFSDHCTDLCGP
jgi:hypothetical protein